MTAGEGARAAFGDLGPAAWAFHRHTALATGGTDSSGGVRPVEEGFPQRPEEDPGAPYEPLPPPLPLRVGLGLALRARRSCRRFADRPVDRGQLATLLHAGYGTVGRAPAEDGGLLLRPTPSAGGLYPLELYVLLRSGLGLEPGTLHYTPVTHGVERLAGGAVPAPVVRDLFAGQASVAEAAAVIVMAAVAARALPKYGDRGYRYALMEAGHAGQNVVLAAACLGLGSLAVGAFVDLDLASVLELDPEREAPLYAVAVGVRAAFGA